MPYLQLRDVRSGAQLTFESPEIYVGRAPDCGLIPQGDGAGLVSGRHLRFLETPTGWIVEDLGSRNGTFVAGVRLAPNAPMPLDEAQEIRLGERGPWYVVESIAKAAPPPPLRPPSSISEDATELLAPVPEAPTALFEHPTTEPSLRLTVMDTAYNDEYKAEGDRLRVGRERDCEVQLLREEATLVSRYHAEIVLTDDGQVVVRDAGSRNGTFLNGEKLAADAPLQIGDRLLLSKTELVVTALEVVGAADQAAAPAAPEPPAAVGVAADDGDRASESAGAPPAPKTRRSFAGKGATQFFTDLFTETEKKAARRVRIVVWSAVGALTAAVGVLYWVSEQRVKRAEQQFEEQQQLALAAQQAFADSIRAAAGAESARLRGEWESAIDQAAPAAVIESLRVALADADARTSQLEADLSRAQSALNEQLSAAESARRAAERDVEALRSEMRNSSGAELDSLRQAILAAETRAAAIEARVRAVRGVDLAAVSQANQTAIALVATHLPDGVYDGSGFVITPSGYLVTNRHVVVKNGQRPDSVFVTMADDNRELPAEVIAIAGDGGPDLALLRIPNYQGSHVPSVDWTGQRVRQGEPAALIGFPAGLGNALDRVGRVRTSMTAGIFSKVTPETINFDGFTIGGSSGSPIFNANGEVVAVHRAGLAEAVGMGFAVPITQLVPLLPPAVRAELGLTAAAGR